MDRQHSPKQDGTDLSFAAENKSMINNKQPRMFPNVLKTGGQTDEPCSKFGMLRSKTKVQNDNRLAVLKMSMKESDQMEPNPKQTLVSNIPLFCLSKQNSKDKLVHVDPHTPSLGNNILSNKSDLDDVPIGACQCCCNHVYDEFDQDVNLEDLVDLPAYDEIPYALIMCGMVDDKTLELSKKKQRQRIMLENIQKKDENIGKIITKTNKNQDLSASIKSKRQSSFSSSQDNREETNEKTLSEVKASSQEDKPGVKDENITSEEPNHSFHTPTKLEGKPLTTSEKPVCNESKDTAEEPHLSENKQDGDNTHNTDVQTLSTTAENKLNDIDNSQTSPKSPYECANELFEVIGAIIDISKSQELDKSTEKSNMQSSSKSRQYFLLENYQNLLTTGDPGSIDDTPSTNKTAEITPTFNEQVIEKDQGRKSCSANKSKIEDTMGTDNSNVIQGSSLTQAAQTLSSSFNGKVKAVEDNSCEEKQTHEPKESDQDFIRRKRMRRFADKTAPPEKHTEASAHDKNIEKKERVVESPPVIVKPKVFRKTIPLPASTDKSNFTPFSRSPSYTDDKQRTAAIKAGLNDKANTNVKTTETGSKERTTEAGVTKESSLNEDSISEAKRFDHVSRKKFSKNAKPLTMKLLDVTTMEKTRTSNENIKPKISLPDLSSVATTNVKSQEQVKSQDYHKNKSSEMKFGTPSTMRLLADIKGIYERKNRKKTDNEHEMEKITSLLLSSLLTQRKNSKKSPSKIQTNMNKNAIEDSSMSQNSYMGKYQKADDSKRSGEMTLQSTLPGSRLSVLDVTSNTAAKRRHDAFCALKLKQTGHELRCTTCGRPDCDGQNMTQMKTMVRMANEIGYEVHDVSPDGNCMFAAVVDQLAMYGENKFDSKSLRETAVWYLSDHPESNDGTHYSNFMVDDWNSYLQKMIVEGEWGDHLILESIVEVVQHTIKVFTVNGDTSNWIELEPTTVDPKDGVCLMLGLVGEVHYISLRPADSVVKYVPPPISPSLSDFVNKEETHLEANESVDMFKDDYIDPTSQFPVSHFSFLLKLVIPIKYVDAAAKYSSEVMDKQMTENHYEASEFYGPVSDGVFHHDVFKNINSDGETNALVEWYMFFSQIGDALHDISTYTPEEIRPGFVKIRTELLQSRSQYLPGQCISLPNGSKYAGAYYFNWQPNVSMKFGYWPDAARTWSSRTRLEGWPSKDVIQSIMKQGFTVVPYCHPLSSDPWNECQILFIAAEHMLFREAVTIHQKHCFMMMIALCVQTMHDSQAISYRHFKNIFFYACEQIPLEHWETHPASCVLYMMDSMLQCIKARNLPNYFIDAYNMIDHLVAADLSTLEDQLTLLRSQPVMFLKDVNRNLERHSLITNIIDRVHQNVQSFDTERNLKMTSLNVFVPAMIDLAKGYIRIQRYEDGYELLSNAFQERLSVSSCSDMVAYQTFLFGAVSGLSLDSLVWFSAYTDQQLEGQLSKSLIRETCSDVGLVTIQSILPPEICGSFCNTEVPARYANTLCSFSSEFVRFLFIIQKMSDIVPILKYCHDVFKSGQQQPGYSRQTPFNASSSMEDDFNEYNMFMIYTAMFNVYSQQGKLADFKPVLPDVISVCERIGSKGAFDCLKYICKMLGDTGNMDIAAAKCDQLPGGENYTWFCSEFNCWPYHSRY